jgi:hypothetical protein
MKKISRFGVLFLFIIFSAIFFLLLRLIFDNLFITDNVDPMTEMGQALNILPYLTGTFSILLVMISWAGSMISKRKGYFQLYKGFFYSFVYSLLLFSAFVIFLIYYLLQVSGKN